MMTIATKESNYRQYQAGCYGTKLRMWESLEALQASGHEAPVSIRYKEPASPFCRYSIPVADLPAAVEEFEARGARRDLMVFGESAPDEFLLIQGEVMRSERHLTLFYSTEKAKMRDALRKGRQADGLEALALLQTYLTPSSYEDLQALFDIYSDPVVEFSAYSITLGEIPGRNTIVWEVRSTY